MINPINSEIPLYSLSVGEFVKLQKETISDILNKNDSSIIGITEASKITGYSVSTLYTLSSRKMVPHQKPKGRLEFNREELLKWKYANSNNNSTVTLEDLDELLIKKRKK